MAGRVTLEWDPPWVYTDMDGTVSASSGGTTLTGSGTRFVSQIGEGAVIQVEDETKIVKTIISDRSLKVGSAWASNHTDAAIKVREPDPDVSYFEVQLSKFADFDPIYKKDMFVVSSEKTFVVDDPDVMYFSRVRTVDATGVKSPWKNTSGVGVSVGVVPIPPTPPEAIARLKMEPILSGMVSDPFTMTFDGTILALRFVTTVVGGGKVTFRVNGTGIGDVTIPTDTWDSGLVPADTPFVLGDAFTVEAEDPIAVSGHTAWAELRVRAS